ISPGGGGFMAGATPVTGEFVSAKLHESDLEVVRKVRGVDYAVGIIIATGGVEFNGKKKSIPIFGAPTESKSQAFMKQIDFFIVDEGRYVKEGDKYKAQVGVTTGADIFGRDIDVGDRIKIEGHMFDVVGRNKRTGNPIHDLKITIPSDTARELFNKSDEYPTIIVKVEEGFKPEDVAEKIKEKLRKHRDVKEDEEDFSVETAEAIIGVFKDVLNMVTFVLAGIAGISLIVGGVGIMTTMYTSVIERTHQIGIMKAVGARNSDILQLFLMESGMLGLVGGIIGVVLGLLFSKGAEYAVHYYGVDIFRMYASPELIIGALLFSFLVGCISGYLPARRASKMNPVDALRYK
ncbi:MAG: ABC transporter permease, partial [Candidatus Altiarchaeales archaeon]|nr:ABC transporter permease [Candidatus Altiarchaeales archaeon]